MIKTVTVKTVTGDLLTLGIGSPGDDTGLLIFNIEGIGSPKNQINTTDAPGLDGSRFNAIKASNRTITMTIANLLAGAGGDEARKLFFKFFPPKSLVELGFQTDVRDVFINGYVENNDLKTFASKENSTITLLCNEPWFKSALQTSQFVGGTVPLFEFPFDNNSLEENLIEFGEELEYSWNDLFYEGEVETGVVMNLTFSDTVENIRIHNLYYRQNININTGVLESIVGSPIRTGDIITIDTRIGSKSVILNRSGLYFNLINCLDLDTSWITLKPGYNYIVLESTANSDDMVLEITYNALYTGVV